MHNILQFFNEFACTNFVNSCNFVTFVRDLYDKVDNK